LKRKISYYKILGVNENASNHELRKAFCKLSIELHPDTTSLDLEDAKVKFQEVLEAYEHLNNSNLRNKYDNKIQEEYRSKDKNNANLLNDLIIDSNNQNIVGNRRPFSNGELFSLFLLIIIISMCLICSIFIASFTGKELDTIPIWLIK
jgi:DnaJ-class molecular chaperone